MTKKTAIALLGAVMLASAAYAIGASSGDGDASAKVRKSARPAMFVKARDRGMRVFGIGDLASKLGVSDSELKQATIDVGKDLKGSRDDFAQRLADALGISLDKVKSALAKYAPPGPLRGGPRLAVPAPAGAPLPPIGDPMSGALAQALGVDAGKVRDALEKLRPQMQDEFESRLADMLGVDKAKVADALKNLRPPKLRMKFGGPHRGGFGFGFDLAGLAKELGIDEAKLEDALEKVRKAEFAAHEKDRDAFAEALAKRLGIDAQKVKDALAAGPARPHFMHP